MRERWREIGLLVRMSIRTDVWRSLGTLLEPLGRLMYPLFGWSLGVVADGALDRDATRLSVGAAGLLLTIALRYLSTYVATAIRVGLAERVGFAFDQEIARLTSGLPGIEHHERRDYLDRLELLRQNHGLLGQSLNQIVATANSVVGALGTAVVLALVHPVILLLVLFALPALPIASLQQRWHAEAETQSATPARLTRHLRSLSIDQNAGMELRVFGLQRELLGRMDSAWTRARRPVHRSETKGAVVAAARALVFAVGFALAVGFVLWRAANGLATTGSVITAIVVCQQVQNQILGPAYSVAGLGKVLRAAGRMLWLQDHARQVASRDPGRRPAPVRLTDGIRLDRLSFRYPGTTDWILRDVSVRLPAGGVIALVGENGAGKTTLVKLLCRLYEPTEGRILVDGIDLSEIAVDAWRERLSAAFQDFVRLELAVRHSVGLGDLPRRDDDSAVGAALDGAGATDVLTHLPDGLRTQLGARWDGGVDLSTGQWQKLALGRALMRTDPLVLFFDEPTASLDAPTEHALFERYTAASRQRTASGAITLLVTHRFSTVRSADLILVVADGRVSEWGNHDELMRQEGLYAELYSLQARSYR